MSSDAVTLTKLAGLLRSGVAMPKAIEIIGGIPINNPGLKYLLEVAVQSGASVASEIDVVADLCYQRENSLARIKGCLCRTQVKLKTCDLASCLDNAHCSASGV